MTAYQIYISLLTMARRETIRIFRIWPQTILPPIITTSLYFAVFGGFLGSRIGEISGVSYAAFITPGLIMMGVITNAFSNTATVVYAAKFQKNIEEILVSPSPAWVVTLGFASGGIIRWLVIAGLVLMTTTFFVSLPYAHIGVIFASIFLTTLFFSLAGLVNGLYAKNFDGVSIIPTFVLTPLTYLGGVFYSTESLSPFWKTLSHWNPIYSMVDLFRYGFLGISSISHIFAWSMLLGGCIVFWSWAYWIIRSGRGLRS
jgi:ABC-2 type transport system permease protein